MTESPIQKKIREMKEAALAKQAAAQTGGAPPAETSVALPPEAAKALEATAAEVAGAPEPVAPAPAPVAPKTRAGKGSVAVAPGANVHVSPILARLLAGEEVPLTCKFTLG